MFFPDPDINTGTATACGIDPVTIATSKQWGLTGKEQLQGATVLRTRDDDPGTPGNDAATVALATSDSGLIKAKDTADPAGSAVLVFDVPTARASTSRMVPFVPRQCDFSTESYGIRTSTKSGRAYVTDKNWCEVLALEPSGITSTGMIGGLQNVRDKNLVDLTLSTWACPNYGDPACTDTTTYYAPLEPTTAPGESIDLSDCSNGKTCTLATAANDPTLGTANLYNVKVDSSQTGLTVFQMTGIPDCRWIMQDRNLNKPGVPALPGICNGAIRDSSGNVVALSTTSTTGADTQYLDVGKLLPKEVLDQFAKNPLPPMLLQPQYRAQVKSGRYTFDGFFGIPQKGVQFRDTFDLELFVKDLAGAELGCPSSSNTSPWPPMSIDTLLSWDLTVRISETAKTVGGPAPLNYTGILANVGCGSTKNSGGSFSIYAFNLELTARDTNDNLTFVRLLVSEFYDLYYAQHRTAMTNVDGNQGGVPLSSTLVPNLAQNLDSIWYNAQSKLSTCLIGSNAPKKNEAVSNCQAFDSQMANYYDAIPACTSSDPCYDVANRRGELKARVRTIRHVFRDRMLPSMPATGFDPNYPITSSGLPPP